MFQEENANIFDHLEGADAFVVTTNGFVKNDGSCVMGAGIAKETSERIPAIPKMLGKLIKEIGNKVHNVTTYSGVEVLSFPVKPVSKKYTCPEDVVTHMRDKFNEGDSIPGWACVADMGLIEESLKQLVALTERNQWKRVLVPRVGCGYGEMDYSEVKPLLEQYLDERFVVFTFETPYRGNKGGNKPSQQKPQQQAPSYEPASDDEIDENIPF